MKSKMYPLEVHNFVEMEDPNDLGIIVKVEGGLETVFNVVEALRKNNLKITHIDWSMEELDEAIIFIILSRARDSFGDIMDLISRVEGVEWVEEAPAFGRFLYCPYFYPMLIGEERALFFEESLLARFIKNLYKMFVPDMVSSFLLHVGKAYGYGAYDHLREYVENINVDNALKYLKILGLMSGGGLVSKYTKEDDSIHITVEGSMECIILKELGLEEGSSFIKGLLEGLFERLYASKVVVKEDKCIAKGDDCCLFSIIPLK